MTVSLTTIRAYVDGLHDSLDLLKQDLREILDSQEMTPDLEFWLQSSYFPSLEKLGYWRAEINKRCEEVGDILLQRQAEIDRLNRATISGRDFKNQMNNLVALDSTHSGYRAVLREWVKLRDVLDYLRESLARDSILVQRCMMLREERETQ